MSLCVLVCTCRAVQRGCPPRSKSCVSFHPQGELSYQGYTWQLQITFFDLGSSPVWLLYQPSLHRAWDYWKKNDEPAVCRIFLYFKWCCKPISSYFVLMQNGPLGIKLRGGIGTSTGGRIFIAGIKEEGSVGQYGKTLILLLVPLLPPVPPLPVTCCWRSPQCLQHMSLDKQREEEYFACRTQRHDRNLTSRQIENTFYSLGQLL